MVKRFFSSPSCIHSSQLSLANVESSSIFGIKAAAILALAIIVLSASISYGASGSYATGIAALQAEIDANGAKWTAGETTRGNLSLKERKLGGVPPDYTERALAKQRLIELKSVRSVPTSLDWRANNGNWVTPIRDQGQCGSCWAFATTAVLESYTIRNNNTPDTNLDLSEQVMLSCSGAGNCQDGGYPSKASNFLVQTGIPVQSCYPYIAADGSCSNACSTRLTSAYKIDSWSYVSTDTPTVDAIKAGLYTYGPLVTFMEVYSDFDNYKSGVYSYVSGTDEGGHIVTIVGYSDAGQYFIVKNSWGTGWGEAGFFRIAYSELSGKTKFGSYTIAYTKSTQYALSITKSGTGSGTVTGSSSGVSSPISWSGLTGTASYGSGATVTLTASATSGSTFAGWSGCDSSSGTTCTVQMTGPKNVSATFSGSGQSTYTLTVKESGLGSGTVTPSSGSFSWSGTTGTGSYSSGTSVTVTALPDSSSVFSSWSGCDSSSSTKCTVSMSGDKTVIAVINKANTLTVSTTGTGTGTVTPSSGSLTWTGTSATGRYSQGTTITLTATAGQGSTFSSWTGCDSVSGTLCTITLSKDTSVSAKFSSAGQTSYTLSASLAGSGTGTVSASPAGTSGNLTFSNGSASATYNSNTKVTLTPTAASGSTFANWSGCDTLSGNNCVVTMSSDKQVTVTFIVTNALTVTKAGTGTGTITASSGTLTWNGNTATGNYGYNALVTLTAKPDSGSLLASWHGCGQVSGNTCTVNVVGSVLVTTTFGQSTSNPVVTATWTKQTSGTTADLYGTDYANGVYVAVGKGGKIVSSIDGINWTGDTSGTANDLYGIYDDGYTFVAVGAQGTILNSTDGYTWTKAPSGTSNNLYAIICDSYGTFIAVGAHGTILSSYDGYNWLAATSSGTANDLYGVDYFNFAYVAVGASGTIVTSNDSINWKTVTSGTSNTLRGIYDDWSQTFVAVGLGGTILASPDGTTWTTAKSGTTNDLYSVIDGNSFVAVGSGGTILSSTNGITWTPANSGTANTLRSVAFNYDSSDAFFSAGLGGTIMTTGTLPQPTANCAPSYDATSGDLFVPFLDASSAGAGYMYADFGYSAYSPVASMSQYYWFALTDLGYLSSTVANGFLSNGCSASTLIIKNQNLYVHIPALSVGNHVYTIDFLYYGVDTTGVYWFLLYDIY